VGFRLTKWYLDCVSESGAIFIGYWGEIHWHGWTFRMAQTLGPDAQGRLCTSTRSGRISAPIHTEDSLRWVAPRLGVDGIWTRTTPPIRRRLFESSTGKTIGSVDWRCEMPRAGAEITFRDPLGRRLAGRGYVECLEMTVKPWQLPIKELRWGRFHSETDTLVWIQWRGPHPLTLMLHNDRAYDPDQADISQDRVTLPGGVARLDLFDHQVLRDGPLVSTALSRLPILRRRLPGQLLGVRESKWLSRGTLHRGPQNAPSPGWAIHEVVVWP